MALYLVQVITGWDLTHGTQKDRMSKQEMLSSVNTNTDVINKNINSFLLTKEWSMHFKKKTINILIYIVSVSGLLKLESLWVIVMWLITKHWKH